MNKEKLTIVMEPNDKICLYCGGINKHKEGCDGEIIKVKSINKIS